MSKPLATSLALVAAGVIAVVLIDGSPDSTTETSGAAASRVSEPDCDLHVPKRSAALATRSPEATARRLYPEAFGGAWIDRSSRKRIMLAFTADARRRAERVARVAASPGRICAVTVEESIAALERLQREMIADRELAADGALKGFPKAYDLGIDVRRNVAVVYVPPESYSEAVGVRFRERYGEAVRVVESALAVPE